MDARKFGLIEHAILSGLDQMFQLAMTTGTVGAQPREGHIFLTIYT